MIEWFVLAALEKHVMVSNPQVISLNNTSTAHFTTLGKIATSPEFIFYTGFSQGSGDGGNFGGQKLQM